MVTTDPPPADVALHDPPPADTGAAEGLRMSSHMHGPFGTDRFGQSAERFARFFGTPKFILGQTVLVARQAHCDKAAAEELARIADAQRRHVEDQSGGVRELLQTNTALTRRIAALTSEIHAAACGEPATGS